ncbi:MAG: hypothetical protein FWC26_12445 [Fibromonadales bacterium]|nr:hypothetical protein [Fibromonadales bacterium]
MMFQKTMLLLLAICFAAFAQETPKVAIYIAGAVTEDSDLLYMVINDAFVNSKKYAVVEISEAALAVVAGEQGRQRSGSVKVDDIAKMGEDAGAEFVCAIEIKKGKGGSSVLNTRIIRVESKIQEKSQIYPVNFETAGTDEIIDVGNRIVNLMLGIPVASSPVKAKEEKPSNPFLGKWTAYDGKNHRCVLNFQEDGVLVVEQYQTYGDGKTNCTGNGTYSFDANRLVFNFNLSSGYSGYKCGTNGRSGSQTYRMGASEFYLTGNESDGKALLRSWFNGKGNVSSSDYYKNFVRVK